MQEQDSKDDTDSYMKVATDIIFTQMSEKAGIKKSGEKAVVAMVEEYIHIYNGTTEGKPFVAPIYPDTLSYKENNNSIEAVNLIK